MIWRKNSNEKLRENMTRILGVSVVTTGFLLSLNPLGACYISSYAVLWSRVPLITHERQSIAARPALLSSLEVILHPAMNRGSRLESTEPSPR
jgi:hypothetical protein